MALFNMPYICGTRVTQPFTCEGTPFCYCTTSWAFLVATVREIFSVNVPMTRNTKSNAIINIKSKAIMSRPGLNVVSVNFAAITTLLADKIISFIHRVAPSLKWQGKTSTVTFKGIAVFIGGGFFAYINFTPTFTAALFRACYLPGIICFILVAANWAKFYNRRVALRPTLPRTILRYIGAVFFDFIRLAADGALLGYLCVFHRLIIPHTKNIKRDYVAVTLERLSGMGLEAVLKEKSPVAGAVGGG